MRQTTRFRSVLSPTARSKIIGWILTIAAVMICQPVVANASRSEAGRNASGAESRTTLRELPSTAQFAVSAAMGEHQAAYHIKTDHGRLHASNPRQASTSRYGANGIELDEPARRWGIRLTGLGYGTPGPVAEAQPQLGDQPNRVEYHRGPITEWYVNGPLGVQQGFTLQKPMPMPKVYAERPALTLQLGLANAKVSEAREHDLTIQPDKGPAWRYGELVVYDANGEKQPARFEVDSSNPGNIVLVIDDSAASYPLTVDPMISQQAYLKASNTDQDDEFGYSVAISGDTVVVGAHREASNATGVNGNQSNNSAAYAGAAYVFVRNGTNWTQQAYLKASNTDQDDEFGYSVAISGDTIVVGAANEASNATGVNGNQSANSASDAGAAYVFVRNGTNWTQQAYLKASNTDARDGFGVSVAISGGTVVVGAPFEDSNVTGVNGDQADNSASRAGAAYVFVRNGTNWTQQAYLKSSNTDAADLFGISVAINGDTAVVGATGEDSNATGVNGNQADNSAGYAGATYVFIRNGTNWTQQAYLKASNTDQDDEFGYSVGISGNTVVVGAYGEASNAIGVNGNQSNNSAAYAGAAYVFVRNGTNWTQQAYLKASYTEQDDQFGYSVAIRGDTVAIGAIGESSNATGVNGNQTDNSASNAGAAYVFVRNGTDWTQQAYLKASNTDAADLFGASVGISGDTMAVSADVEDSSATGINGNQTDNSASNAGAAYVFYTPPPPPADCSFYVLPAKNGKIAAVCI